MSDLNHLVMLLRQKRRLRAGSVTKNLGSGRYRVRLGNKRTSVLSGVDRDIHPGSRVTVAESDDGRKTIIAAANVGPRKIVEVIVRG